MATTKKRSKKTAAKKAADTRASNARKQGLRGAAKDASTKAALARARDPKGIQRTLAAREGQRTKRLNKAGTAISPGAMRELDKEAKSKGFRSGNTALQATGAKLKGRITPGGKSTPVYGKRGGQG